MRKTVSHDDTHDYSRDEGDGDRLRGTVAPHAVPVDLVSAFAGDRAMTEIERVRVQELKDKRGIAFFSDMLYAISHHYFAPEFAGDLWNNILKHKRLMSDRLGRNVRVTVATLDYLSNITGEMKSFTLMSEDYVAQIVNLSMRDGMTGLFNHSTCYELLELEFKNRKRYGVGVALILMDIDNFKSVNDAYGHQEGDRILIELAATIQRETRDTDICCRFGGEEFAVILPFTDSSSEAFEIAERIRAATLKITSHGRQMTLSAGVALCDDSEQTSHALVKNADRALYRAKRSGKNKVILSDIMKNAVDSDPK